MTEELDRLASSGAQGHCTEDRRAPPWTGVVSLTTIFDALRAIALSRYQTAPPSRTPLLSCVSRWLAVHFVLRTPEHLRLSSPFHGWSLVPHRSMSVLPIPPGRHSSLEWPCPSGCSRA